MAGAAGNAAQQAAVAAAFSAEVLVLPIFRRTWLQHVCTGATSRGPPPAPWQTGETLQDKARLAAAGIKEWAASKVDKQWHTIQTAPEGTVNSYLFKLAQFVLRRVDPDESFLKGLPSACDELRFIHPESLQERLVRRRLRLLCRKRAPFHQQRMYLWALSTLPQLPLAVLPLPNVPIYYSAWRAWSHRGAGAGARALLAALDAASDQQRLRLALELARLQRTGAVCLRPGEWPAQLVAELAPRDDESPESGTAPHRASGTGDNGGGGGGEGPGQVQPAAASPPREPPKGLPVPVFVADSFLDDVIRPADRWSSPLSEAQVERIMHKWKQDHLLEHFRAAENRCLPKQQQQQQQQDEQQQQQQQQEGQQQGKQQENPKQ